MKLLHLSHTDGGAGAGRAAYRIHQSMLKLGLSSNMLVADKRTSDSSVMALRHSIFSTARFCEWLEARRGRYMVANPSLFFSPGSCSQFDLSEHPKLRNADIVNLYWVNGGFLSPESLARINKPLVWRLSDIWPFSGGCHYPGTCDGFQTACGNCPQLRKRGDNDHSHRLWSRKKTAWRILDLTVVAPSHWMAALARRSTLFGGYRVEVIPTGIDLDIYRPQSPISSRARWHLPQDRILIIFGAISPTGEVRKGYHLLRKALELIAPTPLSHRMLAVVFGNDNSVQEELPIPGIWLGRIEDDHALASIYNCADVVVVPSLEDNLPNVALEAISCGAPVAAFDVGGMREIVEDGRNGRLAKAGDAEGLAHAILDIAMSRESTTNLSSISLRTNARSHAKTKFSLSIQANRYLELYQDILSTPSKIRR